MSAVCATVCVNGKQWDQMVISPEKVLSKSCDTCNSDGTLGLEDEENVPVLESKSVTCIAQNDNCLSQNIDSLVISADSSITNNTIKQHKCALKLHLNGYVLSVFYNLLRASKYYRQSTLKNLKRLSEKSGSEYCNVMFIKIVLVPPKKDVVDYGWNDRMCRMILERRELDHAMSWLSTLGGAFSALGEEFKHCALMAGRISVQQMRLALRLGDPLTVARCKLYLALSLLQTGKLRAARLLVQQQHKLAKNNPAEDARLVRMCQGVWAKLRYARQLRKRRRETRTRAERPAGIKGCSGDFA